MRFLWFVFVISSLLLATAALVPGMERWLLLAAPCLLAAAILIVKAYVAALRAGPVVAPRPSSKKSPGAASGQKDAGKDHSYVVVDGSNVMHWAGDPPSLEPLRAVLGDLTGRGFTPGVIFDANAGYKLFSQYLDAASFAAKLKLPLDRVYVVPKGTQADLYILEAARSLGARIVTNDRYRDWQDRFPEVARPGFLIQGGVRGEAIWLKVSDMPQQGEGRAQAAGGRP
jgi:hypothetical protein